MRIRQKFSIIEPEEKLLENMKLLRELIENPERFGAYIMLRKTKQVNYKIPYNVNLSELHMRVQRKIRSLNKLIDHHIGCEIDG